MAGANATVVGRLEVVVVLGAQDTPVAGAVQPDDVQAWVVVALGACPLGCTGCLIGCCTFLVA